MSEDYASLCDMFYTNARVGTHLKMSADRGTLVSFFERMQKSYPGLVNFSRGGSEGESFLKEDQDSGSYRWLSHGENFLSSGFVSPATPEEGHKFSETVLEAAPYYLSISPVDMDYLEIAWGFEFRCKANHHEIIAEAIFGETPLGQLLSIPDAKAIGFGISPLVSISLDLRTQLRIVLQPRTTVPQIKTGQYTNAGLDVIGVLRMWSGGLRHLDLHTLHRDLVEQGRPLIEDRLVKPIIIPIKDAIARRI